MTKAPDIYSFKINQGNKGNVVADGNDTFCHAHEVKAYIEWVKANTAIEADPKEVDAIIASVHNKHCLGLNIRTALKLRGLKICK